MGIERELVVARYTEEASWVLDSPIPVTIYNHGDPLDYRFNNPKIDIINIPNFGREAGCWLEHITRNYDHLAAWTYFAQADPHQPVSEFWQRLEAPYSDTTPLTREYKPHWPTESIKALDRVTVLDSGLEVHWGLVDPVRPGYCNAAAVDCDVLWGQYFTSSRPDPWWFGYAAMYAVPRDRIIGRPPEFWRWLKDIVNRADNATHKGLNNAWSLEMCWFYLWGDAIEYPAREIPKPPGLATKIGNFARATAVQIAAGNPIASTDVQAKRKAICESCPLLVGGACSKCGCSNMELKRSWATSVCPDGKW